MHASINMSISRCSCDSLMLCLNVDKRLCADCIDVSFESDRLPAKTPFIRLARVPRSSLKTTSVSFARHSLLDDMVKKGSVPVMANFEVIFSAPSTKIELIFGGSTLKTLLLKIFRGKSQLPTPELVRRLSKLPFAELCYWSLRSHMRDCRR